MKKLLKPLIWIKEFQENAVAYLTKKLDNKLGNHSHFRLCVDELADFDCVSSVINELGEKWACANYKELIKVLSDRPDIANLNQSVMQKNAHTH